MGCGLKVDGVKEEAIGRCFSCICFRSSAAATSCWDAVLIVVVVVGRGWYMLNDLLIDDFKATERCGVDVMENPIAILLANRMSMSIATSDDVEVGEYIVRSGEMDSRCRLSTRSSPHVVGCMLLC